VTGISTGALTAPFALPGLGLLSRNCAPSHRNAARLGPCEALADRRPCSTHAMADNAPLFKTISGYVDTTGCWPPSRRGPRTGERLLLGWRSPDLDAQVPVIWNSALSPIGQSAGPPTRDPPGPAGVGCYPRCIPPSMIRGDDGRQDLQRCSLRRPPSPSLPFPAMTANRLQRRLRGAFPGSGWGAEGTQPVIIRNGLARSRIGHRRAPPMVLPPSRSPP